MVTETPPHRQRIELVDCARGLALVAMAIYHFTWDLDFFGYIEPGSSVVGGWRIFARSIATSFLFIVGFSLFLANGTGFRRGPFFKRLALIVAAALAITAVTMLATPEAFIFFGILHHIALASVLGLAFLRLHWAIVIIAGAIAIALPQFIEGGIFNHQALWWTGFSTNVGPSTDYVPLFPLFGVVLFGVAAAQIARQTGLLNRMAELTWPDRVPVLGWIGKHSLAFYLIHQPVLVSLVWVFAQISPPPAPDQGALFLSSCNAQCVAFRDETFCNSYCGCLLDKAQSDNLMDQLFAPDAQSTRRLQDLANMCLMENTGPLDQIPAQ